MGAKKTDIWLWDAPAAFVLLTRLPVPALPEAAFANGARAVWAYPLVGLGLGGIAALLSLGLCAVGLPDLVVAGLVIAALVMLTGALHEDGLADSADGLWGGYAPARRLEIMKDSQIGTYGVLALLLAMGLRWQGYVGVTLGELVVALVVSRAAMPVLMRALPHARAEGLSRRVGRPDLGPVAGAVALATVVALGVSGLGGFVALGLAGVVLAGMGALARAKIGGQTGDILGATQVIVEITVLLGFVALAQ